MVATSPVHMPNKSSERPGFPDTAWTNVRAAASDAEALDQLLSIYRGPLVEFLRRKEPRADAEDHVQQFILERMIQDHQRSLLRKADQKLGRFRSYLCTAFWNYFLDKVRASGSRKEAPNRTVGLPEGWATAEPDEPSRAFDVALALRLLGLAVQRFQQAAAEQKRLDLWGLFVGRVLPLLSGAQPRPYSELATQLGFGTAKQAANSLPTSKDWFRRSWDAVLRENLAADSAEESESLVDALADAGPELLEEMRNYLWSGLPAVTLLTAQPRFPPEVIAMMGPFSTNDPGLALQHLLNSPVWVDSGNGGDADGLIQQSFLDILRHPSPDVGLLVVVKEYSKAQRLEKNSRLPPEAATVLYYSAIGAALLRHGEIISDHDTSALRSGFDWVMSQTWVVDEVRELVAAARVALDG